MGGQLEGDPITLGGWPHLAWPLRLGAPSFAFRTWESQDLNSPADGSQASLAIDVPAALRSRVAQL